MQASKLRHPRAFKTRTAWRLAGHLCFALCKCLEAQVDQPPSTSPRPPAACCCCVLAPPLQRLEADFNRKRGYGVPVSLATHGNYLTDAP